MSADGQWWFYKVKKSKFSAVQLEFDRAVEDIPMLPAVPALADRPKAPPVTQGYMDSVLDGVLAGADLGSEMYHEPFQSIADRILKYKFPLSADDCIENVMISRTLPTALLLVGIGSNRFSKLPGYLGNMLISPDEVKQVILSVSQTLSVDFEAYFERARLVLDYGTSSGEREKQDVLEVLHALPKALKIIESEDVGLLAVTSFE